MSQKGGRDYKYCSLSHVVFKVGRVRETHYRLLTLHRVAIVKIKPLVLNACQEFRSCK